MNTKMKIQVKSENEQRKTILKYISTWELYQRGLLSEEHLQINLPKNLIYNGTVNPQQFEQIFNLAKEKIKKDLGYDLAALEIDAGLLPIAGFYINHTETAEELEKRLKKEEASRKRQKAKFEAAIQKDKTLLKELLAKHGKDILKEI